MPASWESKSKTRKKKDAHAAQKVGERLLGLSEEQLGQIELSRELVSALQFAKTIKKRGALRRQLQYIGTLMRRHDPGLIEAAVNRLESASGKSGREHRRIEDWRDRLAAGDAALLARLLRRISDPADRLRLESAVRDAQLEKAEGAPRKAGRLLFRQLRSLGTGIETDPDPRTVSRRTESVSESAFKGESHADENDPAEG